MVRLLLIEQDMLVMLEALLSIPQWCDCCVQPVRQANHAIITFNPTMVRLLHGLLDYAQIVTQGFQSHNGAIAAFRQGFEPA